MPKSLIGWFKALLVFILLSNLLTAGSSIFNISTSTNNKLLGKYIEVLEDKSGELTIEDILSVEMQKQFVPSEQEEPGFGFTSSAYWVKLTTNNSTDREIRWYLEIGYPLIDYIDLYIPDSSGRFTKKQTGDHLSFDSREVDYRNFIFHLTENPESQQTYYLRFKTSSSMNFPLNFWTQDTLLEKIAAEQIILGIYYGAILIMIIYSIFLFIGFRDTSYIYYVFLLIAWGLTQLALNGLAFQYLWSNWIWWANVNVPFFIFAALISIIHFSRAVLESGNNAPLGDKILKIEFILFSFAMCMSLIIPYSVMIRIATASALITIVILSTIGFIISFKRTHRPAYYFMTAFALYFLGIILFSLKTFGVLPGNFITNWSIQIGSFAFVVLLSVAVQDRINREKREKYLAQKSALDNKERLVKTLQESERILEENVKERTGELSQKNKLLNDKANELASINRLAEKVSSSLNLHEVLQAVCDELVKIFNVRNAGIGLLDKEKAKLKIVAFRSSDPDEKDATGMELPLPGYEASRIVIETKQPIAIENAQTDPRTKSIHEIMKQRGTTGLLIVPILSRKEVIGTIGMPAKNLGQIFTNAEIELARTIATQVASSIENAQLYTRIEQALDIAERDLEIGRQIQAGFLPKAMPKSAEWEVASYFVAARQVAGDFFDAFPLGSKGNLGLVVADVCDKGVGAALFMVVFRSLIRAFSEDRQFTDNSKDFLLSIVSTVNKYITTIHESSNMFATVFFGVLEPQKDTLFYVNAGHDMPVVVDAGGNMKKLLEPTGPAIGLAPEMEFAVGEVQLQKGDILAAYTDGVTDSRNIKGEPFSEETLIKYLKKPYPSAFSLLKNIENKINEHTKGSDQFDDITMLSLRHKLNKNDDKHEVTQKGIIENLPALREFIEQACIHMRMSEEVTFAYKLAVDEACTNIISHGYDGLEPGPIKLVFESDAEKIRLNIFDEGRSFNPDNADEADIESDWEERRIGGLGLFMIKEMVDEIEYTQTDEGSNLLVLTKNLN